MVSFIGGDGGGGNRLNCTDVGWSCCSLGAHGTNNHDERAHVWLGGQSICHSYLAPCLLCHKLVGC